MFLPFAYKKFLPASNSLKGFNTLLSKSPIKARTPKPTASTSVFSLEEEGLILQEISDAWHDPAVLNVRKGISISMCVGQIHDVQFSDSVHLLEYHQIISAVTKSPRQPAKPSKACDQWTPSLIPIVENTSIQVSSFIPVSACGAYTAIKKLGSGNSGAVYLAECKTSGGLHAIKRVAKAFLAPRDIPALFTEQRMLRHVQGDEHFISLDASFHDSEAFFLVISFCPGGDLRAQLDECNHFPPSRALYYMAELLLACKSLQGHGIIHRDINPENVFIDGRGHLVLGDFGLACPCPLDVATTKPVCGIPAYMAPEIFQELPYGFGVDLWAVTIVFFEMLCGHTPFQSTGNIADTMFSVQTEPITFRSDDVDFVIKVFILHALQKDPKDRLDLEGMMKHACFQSTNWGMLAHREFAAPWKPSFKALQEEVQDVKNHNFGLTFSLGSQPVVDEYIPFKFEACVPSFGVIPSSSSQELSALPSKTSSSTMSSTSEYSTFSTPATTPAGSPITEACSVLGTSSDIDLARSTSIPSLITKVRRFVQRPASILFPAEADAPTLPVAISLASVYSCTTAVSIAPLEHDEQPISSPEFFTRPNPIGRLMRKLIGA